MYIVKGFKKNSGVIKATGKKWEKFFVVLPKGKQGR